MRRSLIYAWLQCKRALRLLPYTLLIAALLCATAALAAAVFRTQRANDAALQLATIGVVGDKDNPYIRIGLDALQTFDVSREELQFVFLDGESALRELRAGRLSALMYVPEDFVESTYTNEIHPIRFVTAEGATGPDTLLSAELANSVADLMLETQNAQYGAQLYAMDHVPDADPYEVDNELVDRYFAMVLSRHRLFSVKTIGLSDSLSFAGYYFCGLIIAFLLLWGIAGGPLFSSRSDELSLTLHAQGFGPLRQVLCEYVAFYLLMLIGTLAAGAARLWFLQRSTLVIPELPDVSVPALLRSLAALVLLISAMQFFLYELIPSALGGALLQFLCAAVQSYVCGCFYPSAFFPKALQRVGAMLPAGTAFRYLSAFLRGAERGVPALLGWVLAFLLLSVGVRRLRAGQIGGRRR